MHLPDLVSGVLSGDTRSLSRAITLVESTLPEHREQASSLIEQCIPHSGKSIRVGITGVPGVGKSTFINELGKSLITEQGRKMAVLAIDPSSGRSGGSILGDKTRMGDITALDGCFIRPSPASNSLGGVAAKTRESIILCEAAGYDTILIETVGVGQSETKVHGMVDVFLLLLLPGGGDELQGIKRGIVEMSDILVVNKADQYLERARETAKQYDMALGLMPESKAGWKTKVLMCSALSGEKVNIVWQTILDMEKVLRENGVFDQNRSDQDLSWFREFSTQLFLEKIHQRADIEQRKVELIEAIKNKKMSPTMAARALAALLE